MLGQSFEAGPVALCAVQALEAPEAVPGELGKKLVTTPRGGEWHPRSGSQHDRDAVAGRYASDQSAVEHLAGNPTADSAVAGHPDVRIWKEFDGGGRSRMN